MRALAQSVLISIAGFTAGLLIAGGTWLLAPPVDDGSAHAVARAEVDTTFVPSARIVLPPAAEPRPAPVPAIQVPAPSPPPPDPPSVDAPMSLPEPPAVAAPSPSPADGALPAWKRFAAATPDIGSRPMIAIVLDDVGLSRTRARRSIALPGPITIALLPYGNGLRGLAVQARQSGHELLVHMPMEPQSADKDPGPNALMVDLPPAERARRLDWNLSRFSGYVGINNHMGSRFTASAEHLRPVMRELKDRGLLFLDSITSAGSVAGSMARESGVPTATRDVFIDHDVSLSQIRRQLHEVERTALRQGYVIAIGHPHPETLSALEAWLPTLRDRGFVLVPVSAIVSRRMTG